MLAFVRLQTRTPLPEASVPQLCFLFTMGHFSFLLGCKLPKGWGARMCSPTLQLQHLLCKGKDLSFSKIIPRERVSPVFYNT